MAAEGASLVKNGEEWFWADPVGIGHTRWKLEPPGTPPVASEPVAPAVVPTSVPPVAPVSGAAEASSSSTLQTPAPTTSPQTAFAFTSPLFMPNSFKPAVPKAVTPKPAAPKPATPKFTSPLPCTSTLPPVATPGLPAVISATSIPSDIEVSKTTTTRLRLHLRLGHLSRPDIGRLMAAYATGIDMSDVRGMPQGWTLNCGKCDEEFQADPVGIFDWTEGPLTVVHAELRQMFAPGEGGVRYVFMLLDDYSRYTWVYFVKKPQEVLKIFTRWHKERKAEGHTILDVVAGAGMSAIDEDVFTSHLQQFSIGYLVHGFPGQFVHASNQLMLMLPNVVEILHSQSLPLTLWPEIMRACVYLINISPTPARAPGKHYYSGEPSNKTPLPRSHVTPTQLMYSNVPDVSHLRVLGSAAWAPVYGEDPSALVIGTLVGYGPSRDGEETYRVWDEKRGVRIVSMSKVVVDESKSLPRTDAPSKDKWQKCLGSEKLVQAARTDDPLSHAAPVHV
ncbi:hypothetical protein IAT38_007338 [Cryptococcus sp. DSM 104549]